MSNLPPPLPQRTDTLFHHAANACLVSLAVSIGLMVVVTGASMSQQSEVSSGQLRIMEAIPGVICVLGILSGIVALCGIPKYGRQGILGKALAGLIAYALLIGLAVPNLLAARERALRARDAQRQMTNEVAKMQQEMK